MRPAWMTDGNTSTPRAFETSSREPLTVVNSRDNVPSTAASIEWRLDASVVGVALLLLDGVVVQPASARPPKASAAVVFNMKFRLCIVFLRMVPGRNRGRFRRGAFELYHTQA